MLKRAILGWVIVFAVGIASPVSAQVSATLVMRSGERISGVLIDLGGVGFTVQVGGQNRQIATNDVAAVEFMGGAPSPEVQAKLRAGQPVIVLRNGMLVDGRLSDVGGTSPLRLSVDTPSGSRDFTSSDVAQVYLADSQAFRSAEEPPSGVMPSGAIRVAANQPWVETGVTVSRGDTVSFRASGNIMAGPGASAGPAGSPILKSPNYPVPVAPGGSLIAKVGADGRPFLVGSIEHPITMPDAGELMLGINDDGFNDNTGAFTVTINQQAGQGRGAIRRR